jgi:uncharacterized membrane protein YesL
VTAARVPTTGGLDHRVSIGLIRFLRRPAVFFAANWAALLGVVSVVGLVPALAGATRATTHPQADDDVTFTETVRHLRRTWRRDLPITAGTWVFLLLLVADAIVIANVDPGTRVFLTGAVVPVAWAVIAWLSAYVVSAVEDDVDLRTVARAATLLVVRRPLRALLAPALVLVLAPVWLLAPLTLAIGFSLPPWVLAKSWGPEPPRP